MTLTREAPRSTSRSCPRRRPGAGPSSASGGARICWTSATRIRARRDAGSSTSAPGAPRTPGPARSGRRQRLDTDPRAGARARLPHQHGDGEPGGRAPPPHRPPLSSHLDSIVINDLEGEALTEIELRPGGSSTGGGGAGVPAAPRDGRRQVAAIHFPEGAVAVDETGTLHAQPSVRWGRLAHRERGRGGGRLRGRPRLPPCTRAGRWRGASSSRCPSRRCASEASTPTPPSARGERARPRPVPTATATAPPERPSPRRAGAFPGHPTIRPRSLGRRLHSTMRLGRFDASPGPPARGGSGRTPTPSRHSKDVQQRGTCP